MRYRRAAVPGGTFFFTVNLADRSADLLVRHIDALRDAHRRVAERHPFIIDAAVILPDHMHAIWTLPAGDTNYATRWMLIKAAFSRALPRTEHVTPSRLTQGERGVWQRRYWEHQIRDDEDFANHVAYIHYNPIKHGHAARAADWQHSSFHRYVKQGLIAADWAGDAACMRRLR